MINLSEGLSPCGMQLKRPPRSLDRQRHVACTHLRHRKQLIQGRVPFSYEGTEYPSARRAWSFFLNAPCTAWSIATARNSLSRPI